MATSDGSIRVLRIAFFSRILLLSLICLWRFLFLPYDTSASLNPPCLSLDQSPPSNPVLWPRVGSAIERSIVWDGVYFVRIAECGYEYEQTYAFFPIFPIYISLLSRSVFAPLVPVIGYRAVLGFSGYVLNNVVFLFAAVYFYRLSVLILNDSRAAIRASILFCFNPASVFYSSLYSESLYALFSLGGLYHLFSGANTIAMLLLALSGSARSNGVVNAGYFCFQTIFQAYEAIFLKKQPTLAMQAIVVGVLQSMCIFAPFVAFQAYGYSNICLGRNSDNLRPWCRQRIPRLYDYLQSHYWGVGFLRYFQLRQLPNFLLASPILSLAVLSITQYANLRPDIVFSLGFQASSEEKVLAARLYSRRTDKKEDGTRTVENNVSSQFVRGDLTLRDWKHGINEMASGSFRDPKLTGQEAFLHGKRGYSSILVLPFVYHLVFLTMMVFFVMHVQVATRFLSVCPPVYWVASYVLVSPSRPYRRLGYFIWVYFVAYILLGSLLFSNFYPFT